MKRYPNSGLARTLGSELAREGILCVPGASLGGKAELSAANTNGRLLLLSAESEQDPFTVAVSIDVKSIATPPGTSRATLRGRCSWGSKAGQGDVIFDLRHGTRMTLDASHIVLDAFLSFNDGEVGAAYRVVSSITYGSVSGPSSLTFTEPPVNLNVGVTSNRFSVPSYARRMAVYCTTAAANYHADFYASTAVGAPALMRIPCTIGMEPLPIPNGIEAIDVTHTGGGGAAALFTVFYELVI